MPIHSILRRSDVRNPVHHSGTSIEARRGAASGEFAPAGIQSAFQAPGRRPAGRTPHDTLSNWTMHPLRRRFRMFMLAALVVALAVSAGTALTVERRTSSGSAVAIQTVAVPGATPSFGGRLPEAASLILTGCFLIGLAAAVRRTS
jgi:hypothetical protein